MKRRKLLGQTFKVKRGIGGKYEDEILTFVIDDKPVAKHYSNSGNYRYKVYRENGEKVFEFSSNYYGVINNWLRYEVKK